MGSGSKKKGVTKELDLGLEALLHQRAEQPSTGQPLADASRPETTIITVDDDLDDLRAELTGLASRGEWDLLVGRAEQAIASEEDIEARLWWIRGHLGAFTLPVSLLAAPFETVCRQLAGDSRLETFSELLREVGEIVLGRLRDVGDRRQEHSVRLALYQLGVMEVPASSGNSYGKVPPKVPRFELGERATAMAEAPEALHATKGRQRYLFLRRWSLACALVLLLVLGGIAASRRYFAEPMLLTAQEGLLGQESSPGMVPPFVVARPVSSNLGALYYSIDKGGDAPIRAQPPSEIKGSGPKESSAGGAKAPGAAAAIPGAVKAPDLDRPPAPVGERSRDKVRTDGPIEGPDFAKGVERQSAPQPRLPDLPPPIEAKPVPEQSYPDGSLNIGGEIRSALVPADVFDSPSYQARVIARLMPGDKVSVEGRVGQWLRIRSRRGRAGFVFAQDIGELEDFNLREDTRVR